MDDFAVREIRPSDNSEVEAIIRTCLIEFGADHEGTAWADPDLCRFSEVYVGEGRRYYVAVDSEGRLLGGVGIGELQGVKGTCELQKMYCRSEARGRGVAEALLCRAMEFAALHYSAVYLETLENMTAAHRFYEKNGFRRLQAPLGVTGHYACDVCYYREL